MPSVGLKQHMGRQLVRPVWWKTNLTPMLPQDSARLWSQVRRHASRSDSHWLTPLLWALRNWSSPHARVLVKSADETDEVLDERSACQLEDEVLMTVTGDPGVRAYSLRHTSANWLFMALESDGSWLWERLWSAHPAMKRYVLDGNALRLRLLGTTDRADRRAVLAITKLQGHLAAATTFMHYLHTTALMQLQAVYKFADSIPKAVLASAARISPSTLSEQGVGPSRAGLQHSRTRAGWTVTQPSVPEPLQSHASNESRRWLSFSDLQVALDAHASHQQPLANIAAHFKRSEDSIRSIIETAAGISGWMASCGEINPASDLQTSRIPDMRMNAGVQTREWEKVGRTRYGVQ